jgi:hypothetical protein
MVLDTPPPHELQGLFLAPLRHDLLMHLLLIPPFAIASSIF